MTLPRCLSFDAYQGAKKPTAGGCDATGPGVAVPESALLLAGVAGYDLYAERFQLAAEVLSPSNTPAEIALKLRLYRQAPDNLYALVIDPRAVRVEIHARSRGWEPVILEHGDDPIAMPEFGLRCLVSDLYRGTPLDAARTS